MGDLDADTRITPAGDGRYTARLRESWAIWGPNGGYVASMALRAAGQASGRARPASLVGHMLAVARFDEVELTTTVLRSSRVASSVRVSLGQKDRPILDALVWAVDEVEHQLTHDATTPPDVPGPDELLSWQEHNTQRDHPAPSFPFWDNAETRSTWYDEQPEGPLEPTARWWWRFRPVPRFDDPWVDACRLLIPIDTMGWPAATLAHAYRAPLDVVAPTVDLSVRFHRPAPAREEWLLCEAESPLGAEGLVTATGRVWSAGGDLLASGGQTMLCRPGAPG